MTEPDAVTVELIRLRGVLTGALACVDDLVDRNVALREAERDMVASTIMFSRELDREGREDVLRWVGAYTSGGEAWLVSHCRRGKVDATYYGHLSREQRAVLGR